jgi:CelD/BcsL family acetyltransferase involved in cellulose biosynthesis
LTATIALPLRVGARTLGRVRRRLVRVSLTLEDVRRGRIPDLPALPAEADGFLIASLPAQGLDALRAGRPALRPFVRQRYCRHYASLEGSFDDYLAGFSAKSRSTLRRKARRLAERSGGALDLRAYRTPAEMDEYFGHARAVSSRSYQERLLDAGLPDGAEALAAMRQLASRDQARGWILFVSGKPVSYLYTPAEGATLIYAHLGYDPDFAEFSPGTVLQFEAMRQLFEEGRFRLFDFTEGEGQHKRLFGTGSIECADLLLLKPTPGNILAGHALNGFDRAVELARRAVRRLRLEGLARSLRR